MDQYNTPISLSNVCDGDLERAFLAVQQQLIANLRKGQKGQINIVLKVERPATMDTIVNISYELSAKHPATKNASTAQIGENGELKVERPTEKIRPLSMLAK